MDIILKSNNQLLKSIHKSTSQVPSQNAGAWRRETLSRVHNLRDGRQEEVCENFAFWQGYISQLPTLSEISSFYSLIQDPSLCADEPMQCMMLWPLSLRTASPTLNPNS